MVPGFFDNLRDHSEVKHRILASFLTPWAAKLGSTFRGRSGVIWYVDGFAGAGKYGDGRDGSPYNRPDEFANPNEAMSLPHFSWNRTAVIGVP